MVNDRDTPPPTLKLFELLLRRGGLSPCPLCPCFILCTPLSTGTSLTLSHYISYNTLVRRWRPCAVNRRLGMATVGKGGIFNNDFRREATSTHPFFHLSVRFDHAYHSFEHLVFKVCLCREKHVNCLCNDYHNYEQIMSCRS